MFDFVLRRGRVIDGTGTRAYVADIGIRGDTIVAIGELPEQRAETEVDADSLVVTPGFIDIHTHSDAVLLADGAADSQLLQGVTTEFGGQCGFSFAPVGDPRALERWMFGRLPGVNATWRSFGEYLDMLEREDLGVNFLSLVGHGALRLAVLGDDKRPIQADELERMEVLLEQSIEQGAWGMSTGLEYWPGMGANADELARLCRVVSRHDGLHATHVRNRDIFYDLGFGEALAIGRVAEVRTQISHIQPKYGRPAHGMAHTLEMIERARLTGVDVAFDVIPHDWSHTAVAAMLPSWAREGGVRCLLERLSDPGMRAQMKDNRAPMWRILLDGHWDRVYFLRADNQAIIGRSVAELREERGCEAWDLVFDLLLNEGENALHMLWTSQSFFDEDIVMAMRHPMCAPMSDTLAICRTGPTSGLIGSLSGFDWTARFLRHYVLDRQLMSLEEGVRRLTGLPASRIGLTDRGILRAGMKADIVAFVPGELAYHGTILDAKQHPEGFRHVLVNGRVAVRDGQRQPVNAGQVLRRAVD